MIGNLTAIVIFTYSTSAPFTKKSNNHLFNDFSPGGLSSGTKVFRPTPQKPPVGFVPSLNLLTFANRLVEGK